MSKRKFLLVGLTLGLLFIIQGMGMNSMAVAENNKISALIVVDPGFSKFSFKIAAKIAAQLQTRNITTKVVKVNQFKSDDAKNLDYIVIGGPTYAAQPTPKIKKFIASFNPDNPMKAILFLTAASDYTGLEPFKNLAQEKGLSVISSTVILTATKDPEIDSKITELLGAI